MRYHSDCVEVLGTFSSDFSTIPKVQHRIALELLENDIALILKTFGVEDQRSGPFTKVYNIQIAPC